MAPGYTLSNVNIGNAYAFSVHPPAGTLEDGVAGVDQFAEGAQPANDQSTSDKGIEGYFAGSSSSSGQTVMLHSFGDYVPWAIVDTGKQLFEGIRKFRGVDDYQLKDVARSSNVHVVMTHDEIKSLLRHVSESSADRKKPGNSKVVRDALAKAGFNYQEATSLIDLPAKKVNGEMLRWTYSSLISALLEMDKTGWNPKQKLGLLTLLNSSDGSALNWTYSQVANALEAMKDSDWTPEQKLDLLMQLAEKAGENVSWTYYYLPSAMKTMNDAGLGFEQQKYMLTTIAEKTGKNVRWAYESIDGMKDDGLSVEAEINLIVDMANKMGEAAKTYVAVYRMGNVGWNSPAKHRLFKLLTTKSENSVKLYGELYKAVNAMKTAGWSFEQQIDILVKVAEIAELWKRDHSHHEYESDYHILNKTIAVMTAAGWSPKQQYDLLKMSDGTNYWLPETITVMKKSGWSATQQVDLLSLLFKNDHFYHWNELHSAIKKVSNVGLWDTEQQIGLLTALAERGSIYDHLPAAINGLAETGWSPEQKMDLLMRLIKSGKIGANFKYMDLSTHWLKGTGLSFEQQRDLIITVADKISFYNENEYEYDEHSFDQFYKFVSTILKQASDVGRSRDLIYRLFDATSDYNRERVFSLLGSEVRLIKRLGKKHFLPNFELYVKIMEQWPRIGFNVLEGIFESIKKGTLSKDITPQAENIFSFVKATNGFIPALYKEYKKHGPELLAELSSYKARILKDKMGVEEIRKIAEEKSYEYLLGIVQMTSPTSGASFVARSEQVNLLRRMVGAGDLRGHIPEVWRNKLYAFEMDQGAWKVREGETLDQAGEIRALLGRFRASEKKLEGSDLVDALVVYIKSERNEKDKESVRDILYKLAGQNDALKEKIDRIQDLDYTTLLLLEQLFGDKDNLRSTLIEALKNIPEEHLVDKKEYSPLGDNTARFLKSLRAVWDKGVPELSTVYKRMLASYDPAEVRAKILSRTDVPDGMREAMESALSEQPVSVFNKKRVMDEILGSPTSIIQSEKAKFDYTILKRMPIELRAVKGPTFGMNGLTSGVCTAPDINLWKDPNFKLFEIVDRSNDLAVGYVHIYETMIEGKKYLTLPGINPSAEFLGFVNAGRLYDNLIAGIVAFANAGGYEGVYIPTPAIIHSNRSDIQHAIKSKNYDTRDIPEVHWSRQRPYPFSQVYIVWERGNGGSR